MTDQNTEERVINGTLWVPLGDGRSMEVSDFSFLDEYNEEALTAEIRGKPFKTVKVRARDLLTMVYGTRLSNELSYLGRQKSRRSRAHRRGKG